MSPTIISAMDGKARAREAKEKRRALLKNCGASERGEYRGAWAARGSVRAGRETARRPNGFYIHDLTSQISNQDRKLTVGVTLGTRADLSTKTLASCLQRKAWSFFRIVKFAKDASMQAMESKMIEPVDIRIDNVSPALEFGPVKRFGLYTIGQDGRPDALLGRFESCGEVLCHCEGSKDNFLVEVSHYAFLRVSDFSDLFGPFARANKN